MKKIIAYYQEGGTIKGFVFPVSEELTGNESKEISDMLGKKFDELKDWILYREYAENITTIDQLMKLNNEAKIFGFKHNPKNKKFYFQYKEGDKEKRGRLNLNKEINRILDTLPNKTLQNIVELKKWILNNRKSLGIDIKIEEKPITTVEGLSTLDNDKTIEGIEYYQENGKNKVIAYYKDKGETIKGFVFPVSKELTGKQPEGFNNMVGQKFDVLKKWVSKRLKSLETHITKVENLEKFADAKIQSIKYINETDKIEIGYNLGDGDIGYVVLSTFKVVGDDQINKLKSLNSEDNNIIGQPLIGWVLGNIYSCAINIIVENRISIQNLDKLEKQLSDNKTEIKGIEYYKDEHYNNKNNVIVYCKEKDTATNKGKVKSFIFFVDNNPNEEQKIKLNNINKNMNEIIGTPLIDWILRNKKKYGINVRLSENNMLNEFGDAEVEKVVYKKGKIDKYGMLIVDFKNEIKGKKSIEINLFGDNIETEKIINLLNNDKNNIKGMLLYNFIKQYKEKLNKVGKNPLDWMFNTVESRLFISGEEDLNKIKDAKMLRVEYIKSDKKIAVYCNKDGVST